MDFSENVGESILGSLFDPFGCHLDVIVWITWGESALDHFRVVIFEVTVICSFWEVHFGRSSWSQLLYHFVGSSWSQLSDHFGESCWMTLGGICIRMAGATQTKDDF